MKRINHKTHIRLQPQLTRDKVVSITEEGERVGVYFEGTDGSEILFETTPNKADKIIKIFNEPDY